MKTTISGLLFAIVLVVLAVGSGCKDNDGDEALAPSLTLGVPAPPNDGIWAGLPSSGPRPLRVHPDGATTSASGSEGDLSPPCADVTHGETRLRYFLETKYATMGAVVAVVDMAYSPGNDALLKYDLPAGKNFEEKKTIVHLLNIEDSILNTSGPWAEKGLQELSVPWLITGQCDEAGKCTTIDSRPARNVPTGRVVVLATEVCLPYRYLDLVEVLVLEGDTVYDDCGQAHSWKKILEETEDARQKNDYAPRHICADASGDLKYPPTGTYATPESIEPSSDGPGDASP